MDEVPGLGSAGDVVNVSEGYARNYLLPKKLAAPVNDGMRRRLAKIQKEREAQSKADVDSARAIADRLVGVSCTIAAKAAEGDQLYGSVTTADIVKVLAEQGIVVERQAVELEHPIKALGCYDIKIKLHAKVEAAIQVWVVEE
jgi:large subunit ribosomal protein L9